MIGFSPISSVISGFWVFGGFEIGEIFFRFFIVKGLFLFDHRAPDIEFFLVEVVLRVVVLFVVLHSHFIVSTLVDRFTNILLI
jgi:hypothetical protein